MLFRSLFLQICPGPAPLFGGLGGQLAPVNGEHLLADQSQLVAHHQHLVEEFSDLLMRAGNKLCNGSEVGATVGRDDHEHHIFPTQGFDFATAGDASRVGQQHDLEQDGRIVGRAAVLVIVKAMVKDAQVEFVIDQVMDRVLEGSGQDLLIEGDRNHDQLVVVVIFELGHVVTSLFGLEKSR